MIWVWGGKGHQQQHQVQGFQRVERVRDSHKYLQGCCCVKAEAVGEGRGGERRKWLGGGGDLEKFHLPTFWLNFVTQS